MYKLIVVIAEYSSKRNSCPSKNVIFVTNQAWLQDLKISSTEETIVIRESLTNVAALSGERFFNCIPSRQMARHRSSNNNKINHQSQGWTAISSHLSCLIWSSYSTLIPITRTELYQMLLDFFLQQIHYFIILMIKVTYVIFIFIRMILKNIVAKWLKNTIVLMRNYSKWNKHKVPSVFIFEWFWKHGKS